MMFQHFVEGYSHVKADGPANPDADSKKCFNSCRS